MRDDCYGISKEIGLAKEKGKVIPEFRKNDQLMMEIAIFKS